MGGLAVTLPSRPMGLDDKPTKDATVNRPSASPEGARPRVEARWRLLLPWAHVYNVGGQIHRDNGCDS
jgi:hypothetical protein